MARSSFVSILVGEKDSFVTFDPEAIEPLDLTVNRAQVIAIDGEATH